MSADEWELLESRFGKLFVYISKRITGDCCSSEEDHYQDMFIAADSALQGYRKKNQDERPLEEFVDDRLFHSYMKTCLWNRKNSKGLKETRYKNTFVHTEDLL